MNEHGGRVFAVDDRSAQLSDGTHVWDVPLEHPAVARVAPVTPPPGRLLARIATISDLHLGEPAFGYLPRATEARDVHPHYTVRAARAAVAEAVAWGAELLVVKGDITWSARPAQWQRAEEVLRECPVPVAAVLGNHDVGSLGQPARPWLARAGVATIVDGDRPVAHVDVGPLRIVLAHTPSGPHGRGRLPAGTREEVADAVGGAPADGGSLLVLHHYPDRSELPTRYPPGLQSADGKAMFESLAALDRPPTLVTCGHSHRNRRYRRSGIVVSEVGSTKDYPGVWAGYAIHEGGIRQVVRRIAAPDVTAWTERTGRTCLGCWRRWTPGRLGWRCFSLPWR
ncbi:MAG TPA: metallophosphoesterase [Acidimicrobiales bacterium]|nr:metallophosphoesterase [Acidimicrobiales bacterium]